MKKVTIRIPMAIAELMEKKGTLSAVAAQHAEAYLHIQAEFVRWLKREFQPEELRLIVDAANGLLYSLHLVAGYAAHLEDAVLLDHLDEKYSVDKAQFLAKVNTLKTYELAMLHDWATSFWKLGKCPSIEEYIS